MQLYCGDEGVVVLLSSINRNFIMEDKNSERRMEKII